MAETFEIGGETDIPKRNEKSVKSANSSISSALWPVTACYWLLSVIMPSSALKSID